MKQPVRMRFRRGKGAFTPLFDVLVDEPLEVLNIANRHFGDPAKNIGGPELPRFVDERPERRQ